MASDLLQVGWPFLLPPFSPTKTGERQLFAQLRELLLCCPACSAPGCQSHHFLPLLPLQNSHMKIPAGGAHIMLYLLEPLKVIGLIPDTQDFRYLGGSPGWATRQDVQGAARGFPFGLFGRSGGGWRTLLQRLGPVKTRGRGTRTVARMEAPGVCGY